jgi:hypothetical protein
MIKPESLVGLEVTAQLGIREHEGRQYNQIDYFCEPVPRPLADLLVGNWLSWLEDNPCPNDDGRHGWIFDAARKCKWFKIPPNWAVIFIRQRLTRAEKGNEVAHAVENAYDTSVPCTGPNGERLEREDLEPYRPERLAVWADLTPEHVNAKWLIERSPVSLDVDPERIPGLFLDSLFHTGEHVWVGKHDGDQGGYYTPGDSQCAADLWEYLKRSQRGGKFLINPTNGQGRSGPYITAHRFAMSESDIVPPELYIRMLVQRELPIVAIYESGRVSTPERPESIHCLIRIDAANEYEFKLKGREIRRQLCPVGADVNSTANKVVQLSRLPGITRHEFGKCQRLLWLDPLADGQPIYKRNGSGG